MTGVDIPISNLLAAFNANLWKDNTKKDFIGRISRNVVKGDMLAQKFVEGKDYQTIMFDDKLDAICFFDCDETESIIDNDLMESDVNIVFAVNLKSLYPLITDIRAINEVHRDVKNVITGAGTTDIEMTGLTTGLKAYGDLSVENLKRYDMHPFHTFSINTKMKYYLTC